MFELCLYCKTDTSGNHQPGCPNNPVKTFTAECIPVQTIFNSYAETRKDMSATGAVESSFLIGFDPGSGPDMVGISSEEYRRLRECEQDVKRLRDMLKSCDPFVVNPESECQECGQGIGEIACVFCGNSIDDGHSGDCEYVKAGG